LTAKLQLWRGCRCPSVSQWAKHRSDLWALDRRALRWALLPCGVFGHGDGRIPAADALCRAPFEGEPDPLSPPPRQKDGEVSGSERLPPIACPFRLLSHGGEGRRADVCNLYDSRARPGSPEPRSALPDRGCPRRRASSGSRTPFGARQAELPWIRGSSRLSPAEHPPDAIARAEVGYPDPRGPDTFCRELVASRLEKPTAPGVRNAHLLRAHPTNLLARGSPPGNLLARALPAGPLPAFLREEERARLCPRCLPS